MFNIPVDRNLIICSFALTLFFLILRVKLGYVKDSAIRRVSKNLNTIQEKFPEILSLK